MAELDWSQIGSGAASGAVSGLFGLASSALGNQTARSNARDQFGYNYLLQLAAQNFNAEQSALAYERSLKADSTKYQRAVEDLKAAGLNPMLATGGVSASGVSSPSASSAAASVGQAQSYAPDLSKVLTSAKMGSLISASIRKASSDARKADAEADQAESAATMSEYAAKNAAIKQEADFQDYFIKSKSGFPLMHMLSDLSDADVRDLSAYQRSLYEKYKLQLQKDISELQGDKYRLSKGHRIYEDIDHSTKTATQATSDIVKTLGFLKFLL